MICNPGSRTFQQEPKCFRVKGSVIGKIQLDDKELNGRVLFGLLLGSHQGFAS